jgi:hypothetical protein
MKKLMLVLAIAGFVACNDNSETNETTVDSSAVIVDTSAVTVDTTSTIVDTTAAGATVDTTQK